ITHDLAVVSGLADRLAVMYAGRIIEEGPTAEVIARPRHPYTRGLIDSVPQGKRHGARLAQIPGMTPSLLNLPEGCKFAPRCPRADAACAVEPRLDPSGPGRAVRCHHPHCDAETRVLS
ncbi:MAG: oligopeptide/dipeptide ABC transporter ATP-binding protein, partial [Cereibacter changlensis]